MADGDKPHSPSEELIRRAREGLEHEPPEPAEPVDRDAAAADHDVAEAESGPAAAGPEPASAEAAPEPPPDRIDDIEPAAPTPLPGETPPAAPGSPVRTWLITAGVLLAVVAVLVVAAVVRESGSVRDVDAGDCFLDPGAGDVSRLDTVDCSEPHDFEAFARVTLDGAEYPGDFEVVFAALERCLDEFEPYVGTPVEFSEYLADAFVPTEASWENGDREALCIVFQADDELRPIQVTGSARGSAGG